MNDAILNNYSIRNNRIQKQSFLAFADACFRLFGYNTSINRKSTLGIQSNNLIAGSIYHSKYILAAHYDTPKTWFIPLRRYPLSGFFTNICVFLPIALIIAIVLIAEYLTNMPMFSGAVSFFVLLIMLYFLVENKKNANDNSSGVIALLNIASIKPKNAAFVLLDNNEVGRIGSSILKKTYSNIIDDKVIIVLDCVGRGDSIVITYTKGARPLAKNIYDSMKKEGIPVYAKKVRRVYGDGRWFKNAVSISSCKKDIFGYSISKIHSSADGTIFNSVLDSVVLHVKKALES